MEFWRSPMNFYNSRRPRQTMNNQTPMAVWRAGMDSPLPVSVFGDLLDSEQGRNPEAGQGHMINGDFKTVGPRQVDAGEGRTDVSPADFTEPMGLQCLLLLDLRISGVPDICGAFSGRLDLAEGRGHPASASGRTRVDIETSSLLSG